MYKWTLPPPATTLFYFLSKRTVAFFSNMPRRMKVALRRSPRNVSHIHKLPPEIWEKILKYLDYKSKFKALRVCKLWNELLENSPRIFWHNEIASVYHLADINTYSIAKKEFKGLNIHTNSCVGVCQLFVHKHPRVKLLSFQNCNRLNDYVISRAIDCLSGTLISLSLHNCKFVTDITLLNIALFLPKLELLDLSGCNNLTNEGLKHLAAIDPALNRNRFHKLRILHIDNIVTVRDDVISNILRTMLPLEILTFSNCKSITRTVLFYIAFYYRNLIYLDMSGSLRVVADDLYYILRPADRFRDLVIRYTSKADRKEHLFRF